MCISMIQMILTNIPIISMLLVQYPNFFQFWDSCHFGGSSAVLRHAETLAAGPQCRIRSWLGRPCGMAMY